jgi:peptidoglycan hydrolase-like protein with peptidoglycan-binding domain
MALCGIARIDALYSGQGQTLQPGDPDSQAIGAVQDLLRGHGALNMPGPLQNTHGLYGPLTIRRVHEFQQQAGLPSTGAVDFPTMAQLVVKQATAPYISRAYVSLVLDFAYTGTARLLTLTSQFEGAGRFAAINANTDKAGLSFGLIQWAQRPGRLAELLHGFREDAPKRYAEIFGEGDKVLGDRLIAHVFKKQGGIDKEGRTTDRHFDLTSPRWLDRFAAAALDPALQRIQVRCAIRAFDRSLRAIRKYAPLVKSERGFAFMLDVANQHGDAGAESIVRIMGAVDTEAELLAAIEKESMRRIVHQFGPYSDQATACLDRRQAFRTTALLDDGPFAAA